MSSSGGGISSYIGGKAAAVVAAVAIAAGVVVVPAVTGGGGGFTCNQTTAAATLTALSNSITAASSGQTVCLISGNYGVWAGVNKNVTLRPASGATASIGLEDLNNATIGQFTIDGGNTATSGVVGSADAASTLTLDGLHIIAAPGPTGITIRNVTFTDQAVFDGIHNASHTNIVIDHANFDFDVTSETCSCSPGKIAFPYSTTEHSGVTVENSHFENGDLDGVTGGVGVDVLNNEFTDLCDVGFNHTDAVQIGRDRSNEAHDGTYSGNWIHAPSSCELQGFTAFDDLGPEHYVIEDNVIDVWRTGGLEWYSDNTSVIRHNTLIWHLKNTGGSCPADCGQVALDVKLDAENGPDTGDDGLGHDTHIYDNIVTAVTFTDGSTGTEDHNVSGQTAIFVGGATPTSWAGYKLSASSPVGRGAASDGLDAGIRVP